MFSKSSKKLPKRIEFSIKPEEYLQDIEAVSKDEDERKKLYLCIDSKMHPADSRLTKIEVFLKGNNELEEIVDILHEQSDEMKKQQKFLHDSEMQITKLLTDS